MIIRVIIHIDTVGRKDLDSEEQIFRHSCKTYSDEKSAIDGTNKELYHIIDNRSTIVSSEDIPLLNLHLAKRFRDPNNADAYIIYEDIEQDLIIKCAEQFCHHHWSPELLLVIAEDLGIDIEDI